MLAPSSNAGKGSASIAGGSKQKRTQTASLLNPAASFLKDISHFFYDLSLKSVLSEGQLNRFFCTHGNTAHVCLVARLGFSCW